MLKFTLKAAGGKFDLKYLYASGGMPSVHSAVVVALAFSTYLREGSHSASFGLAAVFAAIVLYDSFGVRRASGEQAAAINNLVESLVEAKVKFNHAQQRRLREILGHTPGEVLVGAMMGAAIAALFHADYLQPQFNWLLATPVPFEALLYAGLFGLLVVLGWGFRVVQRRRWRKSPVMTELRQKIMLKTQLIGWLGLLVAFAQYQGASVLGIRLWSLLLIAALVVWDVNLSLTYAARLPEELAAEAEQQRRKRWFSRGKQR